MTAALAVNWKKKSTVPEIAQLVSKATGSTEMAFLFYVTEQLLTIYEGLFG